MKRGRVWSRSSPPTRAERKHRPTGCCSAGQQAAHTLPRNPCSENRKKFGARRSRLRTRLAVFFSKLSRKQVGELSITATMQIIRAIVKPNSRRHHPGETLSNAKLSHHAIILMLKNVAVVHEWGVHRGLVESDE